MKKGEVVIQLHKPDANEMLFFFTCGVIISVPLTLFIHQYTNSLLVGLDPFTVALISSAVFAPFIEEFSKAYPLLPSRRNRTIHFQPCIISRSRIRNHRTTNIRVHNRRTNNHQVARTFLPSRKHFGDSVRHRNKKTFTILHDRRCPSLFQQLPSTDKPFHLLKLNFHSCNNRSCIVAAAW